MAWVLAWLLIFRARAHPMASTVSSMTVRPTNTGTPRAARPMMNFDENDLLRMAQEVGFDAVELRLHVTVHRPAPEHWKRLLHSSPNPLAATFAERVAASLNESQMNRFLNALRVAVESGLGRRRLGVAHLRARKKAE
jgi:hypothetical protein